MFKKCSRRTSIIRGKIKYELNCDWRHSRFNLFIEDFKGDVNKNIAGQLNHPLPEQYPALCRCGKYRGGESGDLGGIFWADIYELYEPLPGYTQIVGHNRVKKIVEHTNKGGRIVFCDCLYNEYYLKI